MPDPLHPAVVHFPLAFGLLTPFLAGAIWLAIARGFLPSRAWAGVVVLQAILAGSAVFAVRTGEDQAEQVTPHVPAGTIETHEEHALLFMRLAMLTLVVSGVGLLDKKSGLIGRGLTLILGAVVLVTALDTGRTGGELIYRHGAAAAYIETPPKPPK